eukprot:jgi/Botrbrau1/18881/Bobra.177_2s0040.1
MLKCIRIVKVAACGYGRSPSGTESLLRFLRTFASRRDDSSVTDLTCPASWYPVARAQRRTIIAHLGPANSGKTHATLQALAQAESGIYCAPLRLLAWEASGRMNARGVPCTLITGQEREEVEGAEHLACTVEMASVAVEREVGVVDEVQMLSCPVRGAAFTRAYLGLPVRELHVAGHPSCLPLLRLLAEDAGDVVEVRQYERLTPLRIGQRVLGSLEAAARGDCFVAFSRREVHAIRRAVERGGKHRCGVVYGSLPPSARTQQAQLFNTPRTGINVLAASDAIGMGLNLNIKRVVFTTMEKWDGVAMRPLTPAEVKQIAGRAGRHASRYSNGSVTCLHKEDMPKLREAMKSSVEPLEQACLFPRFQQLALFATQKEHLLFSAALEEFVESASLAEHYFMADCEAMLRIARLLDHLPLSLKERYQFCQAPADASEPAIASALLGFARAYCYRRKVTPDKLRLPATTGSGEEVLRQLETLYAILEIYIWLALRFEDSFHSLERVEEMRSGCAEAIQEALAQLVEKPPFISRQREPVIPVQNGDYHLSCDT